MISIPIVIFTLLLIAICGGGIYLVLSLMSLKLKRKQYDRLKSRYDALVEAEHDAAID